MKLTYWKCSCLTDADCYSVRARTKKQAVIDREATGHPRDFSHPFKVEVEYVDGFDLIYRALAEGGVEPMVPDSALLATSHGWMVRPDAE